MKNASLRKFSVSLFRNDYRALKLCIFVSHVPRGSANKLFLIIILIYCDFALITLKFIMYVLGEW